RGEARAEAHARGAHAAAARVLAHRLVDEVVDRAVELGAHPLEDLPEVLTALEGTKGLLVLIARHRSPITSLWPTLPNCPRASSRAWSRPRARRRPPFFAGDRDDPSLIRRARASSPRARRATHDPTL